MRKKIVKQLVEIILTNKLSYDQFSDYVKEARKEAKLMPPKRVRADQRPATFEELRKFFKVIESKDVKIRLMMRTFAFMGLRSFELANIKIKDIDMAPGRESVFVERKAGRNKTFCIPRRLVDLLKLYIEVAAEKNIYLFESKYHQSYRERSIRKIFIRNREEAGVSDSVHSHALRHKLVTFLTSDGWKTRQIALITGHEIRSTVDIYDEKNPESVRSKYNESIDKYARELFGGAND